MDSPLPFLPLPRPACLPLTEEREAELRVAVVREALKWEGTPYRIMADTLGAGIDCCMILVRSWVDAGVVEPFDPRPYPPHWHLHRDRERYLEWMLTVAKEVNEPQMGDIGLWKFGRCFSHSAIFVAPKVAIHALVNLRKCTRTSSEESSLKWFDKTGTTPRPVRYFDVFAKIREASA